MLSIVASTQVGNIACVKVDWNKYVAFTGHTNLCVKLTSISNTSKQDVNRKYSEFTKELLNMNITQRKEKISHMILELVEDAWGLEDLEVTEPLMEAGIDSLGVHEFSSELENMIGEDFSIPSTLLFNYPTVEKVTNYVYDLLFPQAHTRYTQLFGETETEQKQNISAMVSDLLVEAWGLEDIDVDEPLMEAGIDSLGVHEFSSELQDKIGGDLVIPSTLLFNYPTIQKVTDYIHTMIFGEQDTPDNNMRIQSHGHSMATKLGIVGMSCRFPGGINGPESFWDFLCARGSGIQDVPKSRWNSNDFYNSNRNMPGKMYVKKGGFVDDLDMFDARMFGISPAEAKHMDPQQRILLEVSLDAFSRAGYTKDDLLGKNVGVFVGATVSGFAQLSREDMGMSSYSGTGNGGSLAIISNRLSYTLGLQGPSFAVDTACSSALVALNLASQSLINGDCDLALCGWRECLD